MMKRRGLGFKIPNRPLTTKDHEVLCFMADRLGAEATRVLRQLAANALNRTLGEDNKVSVIIEYPAELELPAEYDLGYDFAAPTEPPTPATREPNSKKGGA